MEIKVKSIRKDSLLLLKSTRLILLMVTKILENKIEIKYLSKTAPMSYIKTITKKAIML